MTSNSKLLQSILDTEPAYRQKQIEHAWFDVNLENYEGISTLPVPLREKLKSLPWLQLETHTELKSSQDNTRKYLFKLQDGNYIEMVLMGRENLKESAEEGAPDRFTICISSQAGCPMKCAFCATGKQGLKRNLTAEEIIDQYRFAQRVLAKETCLPAGRTPRVNNIVMMGQGEPMLNYDNVKRALNVILQNSDLGETKITISTAGVIPMMQKALDDSDFPPVRWAISLHSAIPESRFKIMPSHRKDFLEFLVQWTKDFHKKFPGRTRFIGLEYIMLGGVNDDEKHLKALIKLAKKMPHVRINLIPYNNTGDTTKTAEINAAEEAKGSNYRIFSRTEHEQIEHWHEEIMNAGFTATIRYSQGQDIMAACGQLQNTVK